MSPAPTPSRFGFRGFLKTLAMFVARVVLGAIFLAHGYQKLFEFGLAGTTENFSQMGIPSPEITAPLVAFTEFIGGLCLILGLFTPIAGIALAIDMICAVIFVHAMNGPFVDNGGWELVAALGAGALILGLVGPGRLSVDYFAFVRPVRRRRELKAERERAVQERLADEEAKRRQEEEGRSERAAAMKQARANRTPSDYSERNYGAPAADTTGDRSDRSYGDQTHAARDGETREYGYESRADSADTRTYRDGEEPRA